MEMNYKRISFFAIIGIAVVLLGGIVTVTMLHSKYNLPSFLTASLITPPTQIKNQHITNFAVFAGAAISDATPASGSITGDVGLHPTGGTAITGLTCAEMQGSSKIYDNNAGYADSACLMTDSGLLITAKGELSAAYNDAKGRAGATTVTANATDSFAGIGTGVGGYTLAPGVYKSGSSMGVPVSLILDGGGNTNAVFIFQAGTTLNTANSSVIHLTNGTQACNVFWQVGSSAVLGTASDFSGTIMAAVSITDAGGSTVHGRLLADADNTDADSTGAVTLSGTRVIVPICADALANGACGTAAKGYLYTDTAFSGTMCGAGNGVTTPASPTFPTAGNSVTWTCAGIYGGDPSGACAASVDSVPPATLTLVKIIVGGSRTFTDFSLKAIGPTTIAGVYPAPVITNAIVPAGTYTLSETSQSDYAAGSWSCLKNATLPAVTGASITLASGDNAICTIQNTYIAPLSGSGGGGNSYGIGTPVAPLMDLVKVPSPLSLPNGPGSVTYTYTLRNVGTVPVNNITMVDDTCSPLILVSGDINANAILQVNGTWTYTCSTTLPATHTNTVVATGWANGVSATDIATATVVVGAPIVPPLIHVTKVPNPLALPAGGGMVTYTKKVTNPGIVALSNVQIADDKCDAVKYVSGDANGDSKLDPTETWTYTCQANLTKTTTNTVTVSGQANGLTARDFAIVTVIVATPKLPNTGFAPGAK